MRAVIVLCLFAAANAAYTNVQSLGQPIVDMAVADFLSDMENAPGLAEYLGVPESDLLTKIEKQTQTELGQQLQQQLQSVLAQIQGAVDHGQMVSQSLIDKAKELFANLQQIGGNTVQLAQTFISQLLQQGALTLGNIFGGKRSVGNQVQQILANIQAQISQMVDKVIAQIQALLGMNSRAGVDARVWNLITDSIQSILGQLGGQFNLFKDWIKELLGQGTNTVQGHLLNIQELAQQTINNVNTLTVATVNQAVEFFRPYQQDLGVLWQQLLDAAAQVTGRR